MSLSEVTELAFHYSLLSVHAHHGVHSAAQFEYGTYFSHATIGLSLCFIPSTALRRYREQRCLVRDGPTHDKLSLFIISTTMTG